MLVRTGSLKTQYYSLYQPKRTYRQSVKFDPRCSNKKDLVTPLLPGFLNEIRYSFPVTGFSMGKVRLAPYHPITVTTRNMKRTSKE